MAEVLLITSDSNRQEAARILDKTSNSPVNWLRLFKRAVKDASPTKKLYLLRAMSEVKVRQNRQKPHKRRQIMRDRFNGLFGGMEPDTRCFICDGEWHHRHHIIQIQNGGGNSRANVVALCRKCHQMVHQRRF